MLNQAQGQFLSLHSRIGGFLFYRAARGRQTATTSTSMICTGSVIVRET